MALNWKQLANQKATIAELLEGGLLSPQQILDLQAVNRLLEETQDSAAERKLPVLFLYDDAYITTDGRIVGQSEWKAGPNWRQLIKNLVDSAEDTGCDGVTMVGKQEWDALMEAIGGQYDTG